MPACRIGTPSDHKNRAVLNGKLVAVPEGGDCDDLRDEQTGREDGVVRSIPEPDLNSDETAATLLAATAEADETRLVRNPDFPGLAFDPATGGLFVPGTAEFIGGPLRAATLQEVEAARAEARGEIAGTTGEKFEEDVRGVMELTGVDEETARALVFQASKFAPPAGGAPAVTQTMQLNEVADAIQAGRPGTSRQDALDTGLVVLGLVPDPGEIPVSVKVRQPDGTDVTLSVSQDAALRFFQDVSTLSEQERANLAGEALTVRSQNIALRGQDIQGMTAQDANLIALGGLQVQEARFKLERVISAQQVLFDERAEVIKGLIPESFIRTRPGGQEVAEFRFPQITEVLRLAGAGEFEIEQFDIGIVRIDPEAAAQRVLEAAPAPAAAPGVAREVLETGAALAEMRAAGVPLPETTEAA